jgi:hypothetical protein
MNFDKVSEMLLAVYAQLLSEHATNVALNNEASAERYNALQATLNAVHSSILCLGDYGRLTPMNLSSTRTKDL